MHRFWIVRADRSRRVLSGSLSDLISFVDFFMLLQQPPANSMSLPERISFVDTAENGPFRVAPLPHRSEQPRNHIPVIVQFQLAMNSKNQDVGQSEIFKHLPGNRQNRFEKSPSRLRL